MPTEVDAGATHEEELVEGSKPPGEKPAPTLEELVKEAEGLRKALGKSRDDNKNERKELAELRKEKADRDKAAMTEVERAKAEKDEASKEATTLKQQLQAERVGNAVWRMAAALDFADPDDALQNVSALDLELNADGVPKPAALKKALEKLLEAKPHYKLQAEATAPNRDGSPRPAPKPGKPTISPTGGDEDEEAAALLRSGRYRRL